MKRLLSIDGGGIRGVIAGEILKEIESIVCTSNSDISCLADYFHFIGGTSTGSIIAAGLAKGMMVDDILKIYKECGKEIFQTYWSVDPRRLKAKYNPENLEKKLEQVFGEITLGSADLKTLLMITTKNIGTGSTWFFTNNKLGKFYSQNKEIYVRDLLRASSAAPTYFPPHSFKVGEETIYFVDGGVSSYNNPAFQLFLEATQKEYGVGWKTGTENLKLFSIGTGFSRPVIYPPSNVEKITFTQVSWIEYVIGSLMEDSNLQQNILMKKLASSGLTQQDYADYIRMAPNFSNLSNLSFNVSDSALFSYHRYTISLVKERLEKVLKVPLEDKTLVALQTLDCVDFIDLLSSIGLAIAKEQVKANDFL